MAKASVYHWRVYYIKGTPAQLIGSVNAPVGIFDAVDGGEATSDEQTAREVAVVEYGVSKEKVSRLLAVKVENVE